MAKVACIGAGTVGSAWAVAFARAGHDVTLYDALPETVTDFAMPRISQILDDLERQVPLGVDPSRLLARVQPCINLEQAVAQTEFVQESIREDVDIKRDLFGQVSQVAPASALLMSSTSAIRGSLFLTEIAGPERALVAHPVNPPSHIPLVELCTTGLTSADTIERARTFFRAAAMEPVVLNKEIEGFLLNRLQYTLVAEAMHLVGEGYCTPEDIDKVLTSGLALRWVSIGPFMTAHLNAQGGFAGFVEQLGPMMRKMGQDAQTNYGWTPEQIAEIHDRMSAQQPVQSIPGGINAF